MVNRFFLYLLITFIQEKEHSLDLEKWMLYIEHCLLAEIHFMYDISGAASMRILRSVQISRIKTEYWTGDGFYKDIWWNVGKTPHFQNFKY